MPAPELPGRAAPRALAVVPLNRQRVTDGGVEPALQGAAQRLTRLRELQLGHERVLVDRNAAFLPEVIQGVLVGRDGVTLADAEAPRQLGGEARRLRRAHCHHRWAVALLGSGDELDVAPHGDAVLAPEAAERPARQGLTRIPLALAIVQDPPGGEAPAQALDEVLRQPALVRAQGGHVPFGPLHVIDGHEGRLAPQGEPHVIARQIRIDGVAQGVDGRPGGIAVRLGDPRVLVQARDACSRG